MPKLSSQTVSRSRRLRSNLTDAERKLWQALRLRQFGGLKFRRQHPVGSYVIDFVCLERGLAIEVDGGQHAESTAYDAARSDYLAKQGLRVLRFWDNEVLNDIEAVKASIWNALSGAEPPPP